MITKFFVKQSNSILVHGTADFVGVEACLAVYS